ncbi:MAG: hypothetical protein KJT03_11150 [Verrucomicrobiae bacterium]|nr:hypothetical protein [Verrucomicrobiae bacterium]
MFSSRCRYPLCLVLGLATLLIHTGCSDKLESKNAGERYEAVDNVTDPLVLRKIAIEDSNVFVRQAALRRLRDPAHLAVVAVRNDNTRDQAGLFQILTQEEDWEARLQETSDLEERHCIQWIMTALEVCEGLPAEHRSRLFTPVMELIRTLILPEVAAEAGGIRSIQTRWNELKPEQDQAVEGDAVRGESFQLSFAVEKRPGIFSHQWESSLASLAGLEQASGNFRPALVEIRDLLDPLFASFPEKTLKELTASDQKREIRIQALTHLQNQEVLSELAMHDTDPFIRQSALTFQTDQDILARIAFREHNPDILLAVIKNLVQPEILIRIATENESEKVRQAALAKVTDQSQLYTIFKSSIHPDVLDTVIERITLHPLLAEIAMKEPALYAVPALRKLESQTFIAQVALGARRPDIQVEAVRRLESQELLKQIAVEDEDARVRAEAVKLIKDAPFLREVIDNDLELSVRTAAEKTLVNLTDDAK